MDLKSSILLVFITGFKVSKYYFATYRMNFLLTATYVNHDIIEYLKRSYLGYRISIKYSLILSIVQHVFQLKLWVIKKFVAA